MLDEEIAKLERARTVLKGESDAVVITHMRKSIPRAQEFREGPSGKLEAVPAKRAGRPRKADGPSCAEKITTHLGASSCQSVDALVVATGDSIGTVRATLARMLINGLVKNEGARGDRRWSLREKVAAE